MKMKQMIAAIGLAAVASAAMADNQTFDFGNVGDSPGGTYFNSSFVTHLVGDFMDILTFQLDMDPTPAWIGLGTIADQPKVDGSKINGLSAQIFTDVGVLGDSGDDTLFADLGSNDYITGGGVLPKGNYFFKISGTATGPSPSAYTYTASVTPVPEPGSYAMMLAGLGLMGFIAARRNSHKR